MPKPSYDGKDQPFPTIFAYSSMYVCICVCMCVYMCAYVHVCVFVCVFVCVSVAAVCVHVCLLCLLKCLLSAYVPLASLGGVSVESIAGATYRIIWLIYTERYSVISI